MASSLDAACGAAPLRILLVTGMRLLREGLARALATEPGTALVGARADAGALAPGEVDVIVADAPVVRGTDLVARAESCGARVVAFDVAEEDPAEVVACAEAGVAAIVGRDATLDEVLAAVRAVAGGHLRCSERAAGVVMRRVAQLASRQALGEASSLTRREWDIAIRVHRGLSNKEIAAELGIETATVKNHVHSLLAKLQVQRRGQVAAHLGARGGRGRGAPA